VRARLTLALLALAWGASADDLPLYTAVRGPLRMVLDTLSAPIPVNVSVSPLRAAEDATPAATAPKKRKARNPKMHGAAGGIVSLATETDTKVEPWAWIDVDVPVADYPMAPSMLVEVGLSALPGETLSQADPTTFRAVEVHLGIAQPIAEAVHFDLYAEGVFATRLPSDPTPRNRTARAVSAGLRFRSSRGSLALGVGADQRLTGEYRPAMTLRGAYRMWQMKDKDGKASGPQMSLVGDAILGLDAPSSPNASGRDVVRIGVAIGL